MIKGPSCPSCHFELKPSFHRGFRFVCSSCKTTYKAKWKAEAFFVAIGQYCAILFLSYCLFLLNNSAFLFLCLIVFGLILVLFFHLYSFSKNSAKYVELEKGQQNKGEELMFEKYEYKRPNIDIQEGVLSKIDELGYADYALACQGDFKFDLKVPAKRYDLNDIEKIVEKALIIVGDEYYMSEVRSRLNDKDLALIYCPLKLNYIFNDLPYYFLKSDLLDTLEEDYKHPWSCLLLDPSLMYDTSILKVKEAIAVSLLKLWIIAKNSKDSPLKYHKAQAYIHVLQDNAAKIFRSSFDFKAYEELLYVLNDDIFSDPDTIDLLRAALPISRNGDLSLAFASTAFIAALCQYFKFDLDNDIFSYLEELGYKTNIGKTNLMPNQFIDMAFEVNYQRDLRIIKTLNRDSLIEVYKLLRNE